MVCINKYDINEDNTCRIEGFCSGQRIEVVSKIPLDNVVTEALVRGLPVVEYCQNAVSKEIRMLWKTISRRLGR